jgi:dGTPase
MSALPEITAERERVLLAPYAMHSADSAGRQHAEAPHPYRGPYQRDRDRIIHSAAFRRLSHKTQVFTGDMGDYHRTRLTHTLEVSSIARTIARALRLNEDLVEALALAHDLGHPPFGHSGEDVLDKCLANHGGFNHNEQALRICELLESGYPDFPGLNLTREVLEGQRHRANKNGTIGSPPTETQLLEVQVVDAADSIAYDAHDADDSLELGLLELNQLLHLTLWREAQNMIGDRAKQSERQTRRAIVHKVIDWQVSDVIKHAQREIASGQIKSVADVRKSPVVIQPSAELAEKKIELEHFLFDKVYRNEKLLAKRREAQHALRESFDKLMANPLLLSGKFRRLAEREGMPRAVADYLAGMTDRYAFFEHQRLISEKV